MAQRRIRGSARSDKFESFRNTGGKVLLRQRCSALLGNYSLKQKAAGVDRGLNVIDWVRN